MKKKVVAAPKTAAKKLVKKPLIKPPAALDPRRPPLPSAADKARQQQAVHYYEQALKAMQGQKFDKAKPLLQKVMETGSRELVERASLHLNICNQKMGKVLNTFKTPEEHYDYAVSLMNMGDYIAARENFEKLLKQQPARDFIAYGMAVLECLTGHPAEALQYLSEAIRLNRNNRFQARNDSDFRNLSDDPRFTELLYPESTAV